MKRNLLLIGLLLGSLVAGSCNSGNAGSASTSDELAEGTIKTAIEASLLGILQESDLGEPWASKSLNNVSIEIVRRGAYNQEQKYWPVQATMTGEVQQASKMPMYSSQASRSCRFSFTEDFRIRRNDYGDWLAQRPALSSGRPRLKCGQN